MTHFTRLLPTGLLVLLGLSALGMFPPAARADFTDGDIYLLSPALEGSDGSHVIGILKLDPLTGASSLLHQLSTNTYPQLVFDPFREKLVFVQWDRLLQGLDSNGNVTTLANLSEVPSGLAFGNGLLYLRIGNEYFYLDQAGNVLPLLDEDGLFTFSDGGSIANRVLQYDAGTNAIIAFSANESVSPCGGYGLTCALKIPLTADGTQVAGPNVASSIDVSTSAEQVVGAGPRSAGGILFVVDTNSNNEEGRLHLLEPSSMSIQPFASTGSFTGAATISAGTYSNARGQALVLDSFNDVIRAFSQGLTGAGLVIADNNSGFGISGWGHSEAARMVEIAHPAESAVPSAPGLGEAQLLPPHPNPFNPSTTLRFGLARGQNVRLDVFDVRGAHVRTLEEGYRGEGAHQVSWDGRHDNGRLAASGVYFARLKTASAAQVQRMVLLE